MSQPPSRPAYTEFHPRWYRPRVSTWWWLGSWPYTRFILREISSVFVAYFVALILLQLYFIEQGPGAYDSFQQFMKEPVLVFFNWIAFAFILYHSITWFNLAPKAMVVKLGKQKIPAWLIAGSNFGAWIAVSVFVAWAVLRNQ
jgi:fumarate reductase subunit C